MRNLAAVKSYVFRRFLVLPLAVLLVAFMEFLNRGSLGETVKWGGRHFGGLLLNCLLVLGLYLFLIAVTGRTKWAYWPLFAICFLLALISGIKFKILGVPLLPWDFVLSGEGADMAQYLSNIFSLPLILGFLVFVAFHALALHKFRWVEAKWTWKERAALALVSLATLGLLAFEKPYSLQKAFGIQNMAWDQAENVTANGFALSMLHNAHLLSHDKPEGYGEKSIADLLKEQANVARAAESPATKPNIIVVLSESFWDPTQIPGIKFSRDPIPTYRGVAKRYTSGWLLSPQFGGGTANVEFEVLTGNSMRFLPQGSIPYNQYINRPIDSLASILARQGYTSTAISPFHNWFFNSRQVYRYFGFGKFLSLEFFRPEYAGPYIADREVAKMIIDESQKTEGPDFIFANTMENHFHYWPGKFPENTIRVKGGDMSDSLRGQLETLAQGLLGADALLRILIEHFAKSNEPTIVVFFGDHLPYLGDDYQAYRETGWISGPDDPEFLEKMYRTPVVIWNNYLRQSRKDIGMSPSFLGPYILKLARLPGTSQTDFLYDLYRKTPVIPPKDHYAKYGVTEEALKPYEQLQYDILFGDQYAYANQKDKIVSPNFTLGYGPLEISDAKVEGSRVVVSGRNLPPLGEVYLNGEELKTKWESLERVTAELPAEAEWKGGELQVKVIDSKNNTIAQSNIWKLK